MAIHPDLPRFAYTTLLTRASYLAGVLILAHTLRKGGSKYPLIVYYPPKKLESDAVSILLKEQQELNLRLRPCELLTPFDTRVSSAAERFTDTWTKLRVFEPIDDEHFDAYCYLDADMAMFNGRNMDDIFTEHLSDLPSNGIAAIQCCVCNLDDDAWCPSDWTTKNCPFTLQSHPSALTSAIKVPASTDAEGKSTYKLLNSGLFMYHQSQELWDEMMEDFHEKRADGTLGSYTLPDQDFLTHFFKDRWSSLPWQWNALKTWRYWHPNMWRDDEVVCLHYIVDKPWAQRVGSDGTAGYKGDDGETHSWWWREYEDWRRHRLSIGWKKHVALMDTYVAPKDASDPTKPDLLQLGRDAQL